MSLTTITINPVDYVSYASVAEADAYLAVDPVRSATWAALSATVKGQYLVAATRRLDLLNWGGSKAGDDATQPNAWPRSGLQYPDGTAVAEDEVPQAVEDATCLLAGTIARTPTSADAGTSGSNKKRLKAGSAEIEFFRPTQGKALQDETAFALVRAFLSAATGAGSVGQAASGTGASSSFTDPQLGYGVNGGYS
jgi:hypothetical protein